MTRRGRRSAASTGGLLVAVALLAGCTDGGSSGADTPTATTAATVLPTTGEAPTAPAAPEAAAVLNLFVEAAGQGNAKAMWRLLSAPSRERLGGSVAAFGTGVAADLEEGVGSFAGASTTTLLALEPTPGWAVAAIAGTRTAEGSSQIAAFASALRDEDGIWKLEIGGPVQIEPVVPANGIRAGETPQLGVRVDADAPITDGGLWIDAAPVPALAAGPDEATKLIAGEPVEPLTAGTHIGIAFARAGDDASARAWTFRAS